MKREVIQTEDGSKTIRIIELEENYHSIHGALQEANHVFMKYGLEEFKDKDQLSILEMGFGTGLNTCLTAINSSKLKVKIEYHGIEAFPVSQEELDALDYGNLLGEENRSLYDKIHSVNWDESLEISEGFNLKKIHSEIQNTQLQNEFYDIIFYDAFGPRVQDELWSEAIFQKMYNSLKVGGFLVTYCAKGQVKRNMKAVGFMVEALPGPPGKREMTRAWKK
jgi:tRNA U34 5-methylaminomethyl-2-thiouridine-forming methyltransferase MnmC